VAAAGGGFAARVFAVGGEGKEDAGFGLLVAEDCRAEGAD
jgi:hypothetical protein